jgi:hypothetical protein
LEAFSPIDEIKARDALQAVNIIGFSENLQIGSAFSVVRAFLEKLSKWEREHKAKPADKRGARVETRRSLA